TWAELAAALRKRFQPVGKAEEAGRALRRIGQAAKETVSQFTTRFQTLLAKVNRGAFSDEMLAQIFIDGLRDESLRTHLDREESSSLEKTMETASRVDGR